MPKSLNQVRTPVAAALVGVAMVVGAGVGLAAAGLTPDDESEGRQVATVDSVDATAGAVGAVSAAPGVVSPTPVPPNPSPADPGAIGSEDAGRIAAAHVGGGAVDDVEREDDYGAAWEVDVYTPRGEYEVYVSAAGQVVRTLGPFSD